MTIYSNARMSNPSRYFETADHVLSDAKLSREDKVKVLRSMAVDADQKVETASESMLGGNPAFNAEDIQSALIQLVKTKEPETGVGSSQHSARFQRVMVVTTVDQDLNREIADVAFDMAEVVDGKVCLLNVVPTAFAGAGLAAAGPMVTAVPLVLANH